jgi:hypothetical protein
MASAGFEVAQAPDYRDALAILEGGGHVDLLLVDLVMPGVNGFALARKARMRRLDIKIVYVTVGHRSNGADLAKAGRPGDVDCDHSQGVGSLTGLPRRRLGSFLLRHVVFVFIFAHAGRMLAAFVLRLHAGASVLRRHQHRFVGTAVLLVTSIGFV